MLHSVVARVHNHSVQGLTTESSIMQGMLVEIVLGAAVKSVILARNQGIIAEASKT